MQNLSGLNLNWIVIELYVSDREINLFVNRLSICRGAKKKKKKSSSKVISSFCRPCFQTLLKHVSREYLSCLFLCTVGETKRESRRRELSDVTKSSALLQTRRGRPLLSSVDLQGPARLVFHQGTLLKRRICLTSLRAGLNDGFIDDYWEVSFPLPNDNVFSLSDIHPSTETARVVLNRDVQWGPFNVKTHQAAWERVLFRLYLLFIYILFSY